MNNELGRTALILGIGGVVAWRSMSPEAKARVKRFLMDLATAVERHEQQNRMLSPGQAPMSTLSAGPTGYADRSTRALTDLQTPGLKDAVSDGVLDVSAPERHLSPPTREPDARWRDVFVHPAIVVILGKRGGGKSALAYRLLELFRYQLTPYVVGVPDEARRVFPDWIGIAPSLEEVPPKSIGLVDEAYLRYHARESQAKQSREMSQLLNLSRQREQTLIFVTQEARQVDRNIASSASVVVFKEPGSFQFEFERRELRRIAEQARVAFQAVGKNRRRWSYANSPDADFSGMVENALPTFWTSRLSHIFAAGQGVTEMRPPRESTLAERRARAHQLRARGWSLSQIGRELGVSKATVINYLRGYRHHGRP